MFRSKYRHPLSVFHTMLSIGRRLHSDRMGNIALSFALMSVPLTIGIGASFDYTLAYNTKAKMQTDLDAALLSAVKEVGTSSDVAIQTKVANWFAAQTNVVGYTLNTTDIIVDDTNHTITAKVSANVPTSLMQIIGRPTIPVSAVSSVTGGAGATTQNAFSMYLVLDRSGSMADPTTTTYTTTCYKGNGRNKTAYTCTKTYSKIESLKLAVTDLTTQFSTADPNSIYVRTGAVSYNDTAQTPSALAWGESAALAYVNALTATGMTDSSGAFKIAYDALAPTTEDAIHKAKNGQTPSKFIVLMTDGENNYAYEDTNTKAYCDKARTAGIHVYTVAFMAPAAGQALLQYCATSLSDYFPAENTSDLVAAFKVIGETSAEISVRLTN
jgi:Flp pilus assembly protein TadG